MESLTNLYPQYWDIIQQDDKEKYFELQKNIEPLTIRSNREQICKNYSIILKLIDKYINRGDEDDWKRALICGVLRISNECLAINTKQLAALICKCKSSINTGLLINGYKSVTICSEVAGVLVERFPFMKKNSNEIRQWTERRKNKMTTEVDQTDEYTPVLQNGQLDDLPEHLYREDEMPDEIFFDDFYDDEFFEFTY